MNSYFEQISGLIKYIAVIDRDVNIKLKKEIQNSPIILLNLTDKEKEIDYQMYSFSSLDLIDNKERKFNINLNYIEIKQTKNSQEEYLGLLMPFYEFEFDMGVYGFIGNNGIKIICLKKIENNVQETSNDIKLKQVKNIQLT